ncbi:MAG: glycosyltransferase family 4 protein [Rhizobiales bacterium]|nr:glycosyltransferase family 4 protein [Hyphomicrobiales bacterium]
MRNPQPSPPVLLYLVTEDWYFLSHRLPMAIAAKRAGYDVHVATNVNRGGAAIEAHGFTLHALNWSRGNLNPLRLWSIVREIRRIYRRCAPALVHHVALQPAVIGSLAAMGLPPVRLNALAGLGYGFTSNSLKARIIRPVLEFLLRVLLNSGSAAVLVQNTDDRAAVVALGIDAERVSLIPGSGVDTDILRPTAEPAGPIAMGFIGRLLDDKGIRTLIAAHDILRRRGETIRLRVGGSADPANPASIPAAEIEAWQRHPGVEMLGHVDDIGKFWAAQHIAVLPSRREGLPKSLLEAAACGRPLVATDVPGCRVIARQDVNALLVPANDATALANAIERLAHDRALRQRFAAAGRKMAEEEFSSARIGREIVALYDRLLGRTAALLPPRSSSG